MKVGLGILGDEKPQEILHYVSLAERYGFDSIWMSETRFVTDSFSMLGAFAAITNKVRLATAVINPYTRNAVLTALSLATLDHLSRGRMIFGIGAGSPKFLRRQGIKFTKPLKTVGEYIKGVKAILSGNTVSFEGEFVRYKDVKLDLKPFRTGIPVFIGATGPKMLEFAGSIADGVILNSPTSSEYIKTAVQHIKQGVDASNRKFDELEIASCIDVAVSDDPKRARDHVRPFVATYLSYFPSIANVSGLEEDFISSVRREAQTKGVQQAASLIDDSVLSKLTACGTPDEVIKRLRDYLDVGITLPVIFPHGEKEDIERAISIIGEFFA